MHGAHKEPYLDESAKAGLAVSLGFMAISLVAYICR